MKLNVGCSFVSQEIREIPFLSVWVENFMWVLERNDLLSCTKVGTLAAGIPLWFYDFYSFCRRFRCFGVLGG